MPRSPYAIGAFWIVESILSRPFQFILKRSIVGHDLVYIVVALARYAVSNSTNFADDFIRHRRRLHGDS